MSDWIIRAAEIADAEDLATCIDAAYAIYTDQGIDLPPVSEGVAEDIRDSIVRVAVRHGRIVGGLVLVPKDGYAVLANVAVAPEAKGSGIGRALMQHAEREAAARGAGMLKLTTHAAIPQNIRLYEHLGWRKTGRSGNRVSMEKPLTR